MTSKKSNTFKYISAFDYFDKTLIFLFTASGGISIISFTSITGPSIVITSASLSLVFPSTGGIIKKLLKVTKIKIKKLAKSFY